ncbi:MAG: hypothetical protein AAF849_09910 [Bacteroidota bacterium]
MENPRKNIKFEALLECVFLEEEQRKRIIASGNRAMAPNLSRVAAALDEYYALYQLNLYCAYLSYKNIVHHEAVPYQEEDFPLIPAVIQLIEKGQLQHPAILIYNQIRLLFLSLEKEKQATAAQEKQLQDCMDAIKFYEEKKQAKVCIEMYALLNNFCIKKINAGVEIYKIYFWQLNCNILRLEEEMQVKGIVYYDPNLFRNLVLIAISMKDHSVFKGLNTEGENSVQNGLEWADWFIKKNRKVLTNSHLGKIYLQYCSAYLEFERANFARAYKIFQNRMRVQHTFTNLSMKALHLKILYEMNIRKATVLEYDKIEIRQVLDAFRKLVKYETKMRQAVSYQLQIYIDFLNKYRKLLHFFYRYYARMGNQKTAKFLESKQQLKLFIEEKHYAHNDWFLEKLEGIS